MDNASLRRAPVTPTREADLLDAARRHDEVAFAELVSQHRNLIWAVCLRVTGNAVDAEDALQETLIDVWRGIGSFRGQSRFGTWVYRIASNAALKVVRRRRELPTDLVDRGTAEGDFVDVLADSDFVHRALSTVPETFRVALVLYELCDLTYAEIAEHQGIPVQTVKSRISRGRQALAAAALRARTSEPGHPGPPSALAR